ncbi:MAG: serine hydrolase [Bacteroidetes bacterium]|nr:MAG: serine hydrolase [Bacteroidota bacterium]
MTRYLLFLLALLLAGPLFSQPGRSQLRQLDTYIEVARQQWRVPGMAVAVVKDGQLLLAKGYGERQLGSAQPVDAHTIFNIGSTTKAMTAVAMGMLVDEGKLQWDDAVVEYLPEFQLYDPYATRSMRVRDLFTHNLGLPNADFLWGTARHSPEEILRRMRYLQPAYPLRGGYTYQNIMYLAAGALIGRLSGMPWEDFVQQRIFLPLHMEHSFPTKARSQQYANRSVAHHYRFGTDEILPIADFNADSIAPAGAVWSCITDMGKWVQCMLDSAKYPGGRLLQAHTWAEIFTPQVLIPRRQFYPTAQLTRPKWTSYALGWFQHDYQGRAVDFHTGSLPGTIAQIGLIQQEGLGYYFLGNLDHAEVRHALMYKVFDLFGPEKKGRDWSSELLALYGSAPERAAAALQRLQNSRIPNTSPTLPLQSYTGFYTHPLWGNAHITLIDQQLQLQWEGSAPVPLAHGHFDTFITQDPRAWVGPALIQFHLNREGQIESFTAGDYRFEKEAQK